MWFFRSVELLPRPTFIGLAPTIAMLAVWTVFAGTAPRVLGWDIHPIWLAFVTYFALTLAGRLPAQLARARAVGGAGGGTGEGAGAGAGEGAGGGGGRVLWAVAGLAVLAIAAAGGVRDPWLFQLGWIAAWLGYSALFIGLLLTSGRDGLANMPYRWAGVHPFSRDAMWIVAVRLAVVALLASLVAVHGSLTEWIYTISLGRIVLFYLFEWITILFALTWHGGDS